MSELRPFAFGWRIGRFRPGLWIWCWLLWTAFFTLPLASGWLLKLTFDALSTQESINGLLVAIGVTEAVRWVVFALGVWVVVRWWVAGLTMMRTNMLHAQTVSGGPKAAKLPASPSEAISRFQEDTRDAVLWADSWVDGLASISYAVGAVAIMSTINRSAALVVLLPLLLVAVLVRQLTPRLYAARAADRAATSTVTSVPISSWFISYDICRCKLIISCNLFPLVFSGTSSSILNAFVPSLGEYLNI